MAIGNIDLIRQVTSLFNTSPPVIIILPSRLTTKILSVVHWITNIVTTAATVAAKLLEAYNTQRVWKEGTMVGKRRGEEEERNETEGF